MKQRVLSVMAAAAAVFLGLAGHCRGADTSRPHNAWTRQESDPGFSYSGMKPTCAMGEAFRFFARKASAENLMIFFDGGGACWDAANCIAHPTSTLSIEHTEDSLDRGIFDTQNEANPVRNWSHVFIPYCTGDLHFGSNDVEYSYDGRNETIRHRGFVNSLAVLEWIRENLQEPKKILVTGSSAGSYGAMLWFAHIQKAFPNSECILLGDAGNGVITGPFLDMAKRNWGIAENLPDWIPGIEKALSSESAVPDLYKKIAAYYPDRKLAQYTTGHDTVQGYFYNVMLKIDHSVFDPLAWDRLEDPLMERWHAAMLEHVLSVAGYAPNYSYYIGAGTDHTILGFDKLYQEDSAGVLFVKWLDGLLNGNRSLRAGL